MQPPCLGEGEVDRTHVPETARLGTYACSLVASEVCCTTPLGAGDGKPSVAKSVRAASDVAGTKETAQQADTLHAAPARKRLDDQSAYAVRCWAARSAFSDPACNCLGEAAHPKLGSRHIVKVVVGGWYVHFGSGLPRMLHCNRLC